MCLNARSKNSIKRTYREEVEEIRVDFSLGTCSLFVVISYKVRYFYGGCPHPVGVFVVYAPPGSTFSGV